MRPLFADPKTDFVFKRIFGSEVHKPLLIELLNALLELEGDHRIADLKYLSPEQHVPVEELKLSLVESAQYIVPVSRSAADQIKALRMQASGKFISASYPGVFEFQESAPAPRVGRAFRSMGG